MPTSHFRQLNEIVQLIFIADPRSVLDVGPGFGKYGVLAREYLEAFGGSPGEPRRTIEALEVHEGYIGPLHRCVYDRIIVGDATDAVRALDRRYDLILLIDVIEHVARGPGERLLDDSLRAARNVLVSTPRRIGRQEGTAENPHEAHVCQWTEADFARLPSRVFVPNDDSIILLVGEDAPRIAQVLGYLRLKRLVKRWAPFLKFAYRARRRALAIPPRCDL